MKAKESGEGETKSGGMTEEGGSGQKEICLRWLDVSLLWNRARTAA